MRYSLCGKAGATQQGVASIRVWSSVRFRPKADQRSRILPQDSWRPKVEHLLGNEHRRDFWPRRLRDVCAPAVGLERKMVFYLWL